MTHNTLSVNLFLVWYLIFLNGITALHEKGSTKIQNYAIHKFNKRKLKKKNFYVFNFIKFGQNDIMVSSSTILNKYSFLTAW